jgi:hypothetical protein
MASLLQCMLLLLFAAYQKKISAAAAGNVPQLLYLGVRSGDRPVDLTPEFSPDHYIYTAALDFESESFAVDATPPAGMELENPAELKTTKIVAPGGQVPVTVKVTDILSSASMQYTVSVTRHDGAVDTLRSLRVVGATLTPSFAPAVTEYFVQLKVEQDMIAVSLVPFDAGQTVQVRALPEEFDTVITSTSTTTTPLLESSNLQTQPLSAQNGTQVLQQNQNTIVNDTAASRVLAATSTGTNSINESPAVSGETQYSAIQRWFPVELAGSRRVLLTVRAANGNAALNRTYIVKVSRAACPPSRPFYAPDLERCAITCNEGFFREASASRCERCQEHCMSCDGWETCRSCEASEWRELRFFHLHHGHCIRMRIPWAFLGLCAAVATVVLSICSCCACSCWPTPGRRASRRKQQRPWKGGIETNRLLDDAGSEGSGGEPLE